MRLHLPFFSVIVEEDWERTEREMISNQVIQNSIDEYTNKEAQSRMSGALDYYNNLK